MSYKYQTSMTLNCRITFELQKVSAGKTEKQKSNINGY